MRPWAWILTLLLTGCSWKLPGIVPASRDVPLTLGISEEQLLAAGEKTSLTVSIAPSRLQAMPEAWDQVEVTLGHASLLPINQTRTASQAGGSTVSVIFTGLRPGADYTLTVNLYANQRLKAQGRKDGISLAAGSNGVNVSMTLAPWVIQRVAGIGIEGSPASKAVLSLTGKVAVDGSGNVYLGNKALFRVFKVDPAGILTTVAGNGGGGSNGDGNLALSGAVLSPASLVLDGAGNLYFADPSAHRIRKIDTDGIITTVAGNGSQGYLGDGVAATSTRLNVPEDVAVDAAGNLYIADKENHRIRKVDASSGTITTVAGNGTGGFGGDGGAATEANLYYPSGVTLDSAGNLYIADTSNQRIRRVDAATGTITTVAGSGTAGFGGDGGAATSAKLSYPTSVAVDASGNLYLADKNNHRVRKVDAADETISTVAGTGTGNYNGDGGPATDAWLWEPGGVTLDASGNLYITERSNRRVRKVDAATGVISTVAGSGSVAYEGDGGLGTSAKLNYPRGLALDNLGNLFIADTDNHRIRKLEPGGIITTVAGGGSGTFGGDGGAATSAALRSPAAVAVDAAGNLFIADSTNHRIRKVDTNGIITTVAGNGTAGYAGDGGLATAASLKNPQGVAVDGQGNLYIGDTSNNRVRKVDANGIITTVAGNGTSAFAGDGGAATAASLSQPAGVAVDASGNLYIADAGNGKVRKVDSSGVITSIPGIGTSLNHAVAVDGSGNLYVAETYSHRIRKRDPLGNVTVIAGSSPGSSLDGGDPTQAKILYPRGVAANGEVYLADSHNQCVRRLF